MRAARSGGYRLLVDTSPKSSTHSKHSSSHRTAEGRKGEAGSVATGAGFRAPRQLLRTIFIFTSSHLLSGVKSLEVFTRSGPSGQAVVADRCRPFSAAWCKASNTKYHAWTAAACNIVCTRYDRYHALTPTDGIYIFIRK